MLQLQSLQVSYNKYIAQNLTSIETHFSFFMQMQTRKYANAQEKVCKCARETGQTVCVIFHTHSHLLFAHFTRVTV